MVCLANATPRTLYSQQFQNHSNHQNLFRQLFLGAASSSQSAICPYCQTFSKKRHSVYVRKPQALPCADASIHLLLSVNRYFCQNPSCSHKTFAERIPELVDFYSRRTTTLDALLKWIAFEMSAETASRVCKRLKIQMSPDSLLRLIRKTDFNQKQVVRVLGVDDWATKKGKAMARSWAIWKSIKRLNCSPPEPKPP